MMDFSLANMLVYGVHKTTVYESDLPPAELVVLDIIGDDGVIFPTVMPPAFAESYLQLAAKVVAMLEEHYSTVEIHRTGTAPTYPTVWAGVDTNSATWHNDGDEGGTMFALLYFDPDPAAGHLYVRSTMTNEQTVIHPTRGDLIFVSNDPTFQHRADLPRGMMTNMTFTCSY